MGLDMYLFRTKKVPGLTGKQYAGFDDLASGAKTLKEAACQVPPELKEAVKERGETYKWYSIFEQAAYWRKANAVHAWFVQHAQDGEDECQYTFVSKEQLEALLETVRQVISDPEKAEDLLPTQSGFFFGNTEYGEWYLEDLKLTADQLTKVLAETDWGKQVVLYHSSW